jgi:pSer/pThr/pTyr-binding forkhead associated (FHA) protein
VRLLECARSHGHCVAGTRFCKYCGAPLETDRAAPPPEGERGAGEADRARGARAAVAAVARAGASPRAGAERAGGAPAAPTGLGGEPWPTAEVRVAPQQPQEDVTTLPSSIETSSGARPSPVPVVPLRSPYAVRMAAAWPEPRPARAPEGAADAEPRPAFTQGRLVVIVEDGSEGKSFPLSGRQIDVGRAEGDILLEDDQYVSPRHARLIPHEGTWLLRDLGSVNRIYVRIRKPHTLRDGDLLLLGLEVLQFQTVSDGERGLGHAIQHGTLLFGSPAIQRRARLCQRTVEGVVRDVYHLHRDETVIGRETGDIVFTADPFLSRRHAALRRNPGTGEYSLTDLDSSNGTYVAIRNDVNLVNGDFVRIGQHLFRVDLS